MTSCFRFSLAATVSLTLLLGSPCAAAAGTATASITNVRLGVLDLTPEDGVAAGFGVHNVDPALYASLYSGTTDFYASGYPAPDTPAHVGVSQGSTFSAATTSGTLGDVAATAYSAGGLGDYGYVSASANQTLSLWLQPHSVLTIAGHVASYAARENRPGTYYDIIGMTYIGLVDENGHTFTQYVRQSLAYGDWEDDMAIDEDFTLAFANGNAWAVPVTVNFQAWSNVMEIAVAVPEPSMMALLGAGLLLLAAPRVRHMAAGQRIR